MTFRNESNKDLYMGKNNLLPAYPHTKKFSRRYCSQNVVNTVGRLEIKGRVRREKERE
jgi:hypothetical protein